MVDKNGNKYLSDNIRLMAEWDWDKNKGINPNTLTYKTHKMAWWRCEKGHSWKSSVANRQGGRGCPFCVGKAVLVGFNDLKSNNQSLALEWHPNKNGELKPTMVSVGSNKKVWWMCKKGHEWECTVYDRQKGQGCPICSGRQVLAGFNDLQSNNPSLAMEWNSNKNGHLKPTMVLTRSSKKVWWMCKKGHEWKSSIGKRQDGQGCPICSGKQVLAGFNDLQSNNPSVAMEWNLNKNGYLKPTMVSTRSNKKVWWKCEKGHEWECTVDKRQAGQGCPFCSGRRVLEGFNDLATVNPNIAHEWHSVKNERLKPSNVTKFSNKVVWWQCNKGHNWSAKVSDRSLGQGCPICANKQVLVGYNDLATTIPEIAQEWHPTKNGKLKPYDVVAGSERKVWWKCKKGHEWEVAVAYRSGGTGCPICNNERHISFPEKALYFYVKKYFNDAIANYNDKRIGNLELDVYIPAMNIGLEYDGIYHKRERDINKNTVCKRNGIKLIRLRVKDIGLLNDSSIDYIVSPNDCDLQRVIRIVIKKELKVENPEINIKLDKNEIYSLMDMQEKVNSFASKHPELVREWDYEKNGVLKPELVFSRSGKSVWWICANCTKSYYRRIADRSEGSGCPSCSKLRAANNRNQNRILKNGSLLDINPQLAGEWNYEKNIDILPTSVSAHSNKKVWWKGRCGHEWEASINNRSKSQGCPYCSHVRLLAGLNDTQTLFPGLVKEWNYDRNGDLKPTMIIAASRKKVWWKCCKCNNEWMASVDKRSQGRGCPACSRKKKRK